MSQHKVLFLFLWLFDNFFFLHISTIIGREMSVIISRYHLLIESQILSLKDIKPEDISLYFYDFGVERGSIQVEIVLREHDPKYY